LSEHHRLDRYGFTPPGHRQGRGVYARTREVLGAATFRSDVLVSAGFDDRSSSRKLLKTAQQLMADAVGAEHAFFSTCGSSLSVKAAMLAVTGLGGDLLVSRDAHKSVTARHPGDHPRRADHHPGPRLSAQWAEGRHGAPRPDRPDPGKTPGSALLSGPTRCRGSQPTVRFIPG
jgi:hypothetical protein